jgi:signal transduction histidine kinase
MPRSIMERAAALGGNTRVESNDPGGTVVIVEIPL